MAQSERGLCAAIPSSPCADFGYTPIPLPDRDHSGSAALLEADSASEEVASGLAADGQEEGKDKGKGKAQLRPVGPSKVRAQTKLTPLPTD